MKDARRIKMISGDQTAGFVLTSPPFPERGDTVEFMRRKWIVTSVEPETIILNVPRVELNAKIKVEYDFTREGK